MRRPNASNSLKHNYFKNVVQPPQTTVNQANYNQMISSSRSPKQYNGRTIEPTAKLNANKVNKIVNSNLNNGHMNSRDVNDFDCKLTLIIEIDQFL